MKILVIIPSLHRGGAERVVSLLTTEWAKSNEVVLSVFDASCPAYSYGGQLVDLACAARGGVFNQMKNALSRVGNLVRLIRYERPDHIISFMESANFPVVLAAALTGHLGSLTVSVRNDPGRFPIFYRGLIPFLYRLPRRVVAVSAGVSEALVGMGVPRRKAYAIPNPIALEAGRDTVHPAVLSARFILAVGRLHPQKGFDRLLQAFASLALEDLHLVILGEGAKCQVLATLALELGIASRVHLIGSVIDPFPWYQKAQCFVLSSRYEGWPNVLMEAMACACPVVSFDCNYGPVEIIEDGVSGLLVKEGDVAGLAAAIRRVLNDDELRIHLANQGRLRVAQFDVEKIAKQWLEESQ